MTIRRNSSDEADFNGTDGEATQRLREVENQAMVSRRGVLWRAGLATAAGVGVVAALDGQQAQAVTGGNFILGNANSAANTTSLSAPVTATLSSQLMNLDGTNVTVTTLFVQGPNGGTGVTAQSTGTALSGSSSGGTGVNGSSSSGSGVNGSSTSGSGVSGSSSTGAGVHATSTGSGPALQVNGKTHFSRSGAASVAQGSATKTVTVAGMTASSLVLVTLQVSVSGLYIAGAVPGSGKFTVHLNKAAPTATRFAWFALAG